MVLILGREFLFLKKRNICWCIVALQCCVRFTVQQDESAACVHMLLLFSCFHCVPLCDPMDCSLPGSSVHGILQARVLESVAMPFSRGSSWLRGWTQVPWIAGTFFTTQTPGKSRLYVYPLPFGLPSHSEWYSPELTLDFMIPNNIETQFSVIYDSPKTLIF